MSIFNNVLDFSLLIERCYRLDFCRSLRYLAYHQKQSRSKGLRIHYKKYYPNTLEKFVDPLPIPPRAVPRGHRAVPGKSGVKVP